MVESASIIPLINITSVVSERLLGGVFLLCPYRANHRGRSFSLAALPKHPIVQVGGF